MKHNIICIKGVVDENLTKEIANDLRLPVSIETTIVEHLPIFKEWQERIDKLQNA